MEVCAKTCACNETMINTKTGCVSSRAVEKGAWVMNRTKADGILNYIDLTVAIDDTYISGLINNTDPLARIFPLPEFKNITDVRDKSVMYAWKDGTLVKVRDGIRKFDGMLPPPFASTQMVAILDAMRCASPCKFSIDANETIWGRISADGTKLYPMRMDAGSIDAIYTNPTDTEPEMIAYSYNLHPSERDCEVRGLKASELTGDINPLDYVGLLDVNMEVVSCTTTVLTVRLSDNFGSIMPGMSEAVVGFLVANFALYNKTTASAILLTGTGAAFAEGPAGTYAMTYKTSDQPASTNHLRLTPTKTGFDCSDVPNTTIVVA